MNEHATLIAEALEKVEQTHRAHGRAVAALHKLMAAAVVEYGPLVGLDDRLVARAVAPKDPPPIDA
jgi:hypothetical protein